MNEQLLQHEITRRIALRRPTMIQGPWYEYSRERGCVSQYLALFLAALALVAVL
jgi:hypothetical protein